MKRPFPIRGPNWIRRLAAGVLAFSLLTTSSSALACACGCGLFDIGAEASFPTGFGATVFTEIDRVDQTTNASGTSPSPAALNPDQRIRSTFYTVKFQQRYVKSHRIFDNRMIGWNILRFPNSQSDGLFSR